MRLVESTGLQVTAPPKPKRTNRGAWRDRVISVPPWLLEHRGELSQGAMLLYGLLGQYEGRPVTYVELAKHLCVTKDGVRFLVDALVQMTLIQVERTGRGNLYRYTDHLWKYAL